MIEVKNLSKSYAGFRAVNNISFHVDKGEIVGFLGPNGAGKSTTMKVLAGYHPPTDGQVTVAGYDIITQSLEVRRRVGYMPENVPLYVDMRVNEFLNFRARLKGVHGKRLKERLDTVKHQCGLTDVSNKIIGTLSKGYRQRVGLADALVHEPELLILDEPTIGLDPNQIRSVRDLIKELGKEHTILLSTHILSEVEVTCNRVLIINRGKIEASDTPANLMRMVRGGGGIQLQVKAAKDEILKRFKTVAEVDEVEIEENGEWPIVKIYAQPGADIRDAVYQAVYKEGWKLREMSRLKASLEDAFVELTRD